jgi:hypothetical protein
MRVRINYKGRIQGLDKAFTEIVKSCWSEDGTGLGFEEADQVCKDFAHLAREITELAWICMQNAGRGRYMGYEIEIFITVRGITWQRYQSMAAPPPVSLLSFWHSLASAKIEPKMILEWRTFTSKLNRSLAYE